MNYLKTLVITAFLIAGLTTVTAQDAEKSVKIATAEVPAKVKNTLKDYAGYRIEEQASFVKKKGAGTIYAFKVHRKHSSYILLINKKGKVVGIKDGERTQ